MSGITRNGPARSGDGALRWLVLLLGAVLLTACSQESATPDPAEVAEVSALQHADQHLDRRYVCPMHPKIIKDQPDNCPLCGMALVERRIDVSAEAYPQVSLDAAVVQTLGVRTAEVERGELWKFIKTVGYVSYNEENLTVVEMRTQGWIENLAVRGKGLPVKKGQLLFELYSPEYLKVQKEFIAAQKKDQSGIRMQYSQRQESIEARDKLRYLQIPESTLNRIAREGKPQYRIPVYASHPGTIVKLNISKQQYVYPFEELLTLADTSTMWVEARVYEHQLDWLRLGLLADVEVKALPGTTYKGEVNFIYPELDPRTRSLRVRLRVPNPDGRLRPNMFASVNIYGGPKKDVLKIPREALIVTGTRESVVLDRGDGRFQPVDVVAGMQSHGEVEILSGLREGERVVTSGQFLIDSEANLQASFNRLHTDDRQGE
ncbi:MAG: efflux RND transporter periplasmic adaptor subunit [Gammaproteobacteria bacterium]